LAIVARNLTTRQLAKGAVVFGESEPARELFIVASGKLELSSQGVSVRSFKRGDVFGEIGLIDRHL